MDRLNQLKTEAGDSRDSSLNISSPPSEAYVTAYDNSKLFLSANESSFNTPKDASTADSGADVTISNASISNLSPIRKSDLDNYKIGKQIEAANILSGGVNIFDDNDNSYDGDDLVIDDNAIEDDKSNSELKLIEDADLSFATPSDNLPESSIDDTVTAIPSKDTEVVLQIDGKNVDAIDIGNGLYLYRKEGEEELAAVQIIDEDQQPASFKFLKVRENSEGNLEVYEEIEIKVPKEVPLQAGKSIESTSHVPVKDINKVINETAINKTVERNSKICQKEITKSESDMELKNDSQSETKTELNLNGKMVKFSESRKSPLIGTFTPMTYHSTPNKEGIPLTKTMVDQQLHPNRHSDNIKKTIEVHTENCKQRLLETPIKNSKELPESSKAMDIPIPEKEIKTDVFVKQSEIMTTHNTSPNKKENSYVTSKDDQKIDKTKVLNADLKPEENNINCTEEVSKSPCLQPDTITNDVKIFQDCKTIINESNSLIENEKMSTTVIDMLKNDKVHDESEDNIEYYKTVNDGKILSLKDSESEPKILPQNCDLTSDTKIADNKVISSEESIISNVEHQKEIDTNQFASKNNTSAIIAKLPNNSNDVHHKIDNVLTNETVSEKPLILPEIKIDEQPNLELQSCGSSISNIQQAQASFNTNTDKNIKDDSKTNKIENVNTPTDKSFTQGLKNLDDPMQKMKTIDVDTDNSMCPQQIKPKEVTVIANKDQYNASTNASQDIKVLGQETTFTTKFVNKLEDNVKNGSKRNLPKSVEDIEPKSTNNRGAVPFGKWTEANRQEFLNKIKEAKVPITNSNTKQLKQPNDLNRRDVLQKIDSQRQQSHIALAKAHDLSKKREQPTFKQDVKITLKGDRPMTKIKQINCKRISKDTELPKLLPNSSLPKKEVIQRREINNQALIDKTIEGIINRAPHTKPSNEDLKQPPNIDTEKQKGSNLFSNVYNIHDQVALDDIEMKMNELHGIPFVERPAHELPQKSHPSNENQKLKSNKIPNLLPFTNKPQTKTVRENVVEIDSDNEVIEHEPLTGDMETNKKSPDLKEKSLLSETKDIQTSSNVPNKDVIITEKDFDKFHRRNSVTYENRLTVNFDSKEPHNVIQTVVEKEIASKKLSRNEVLLAESKAKSNHKHQMLRNSNYPTKIPTAIKYPTTVDDAYTKNYQSKLQIAYHSALTAKLQKETPTTIIEDKPVKVVYMDSNIEFAPSQLNVQGEPLFQTKKSILESCIHSNTDSLDSDILDNLEMKSQDETKSKGKHQRKQVLTPVEVPDMELIEPSDLGIEISPKKKRKIEDKPDKSPRNHVPKKTYLLGRAIAEDEPKLQDICRNSLREYPNKNESFVAHSDTISAIDNLVKAAEMLENQSENKSSVTSSQDSDSQHNTPIKRGRGRPRKYPLPDVQMDKSKTPSPQKKARLMDAKVVKEIETDEYDTSDDEIIKENWTMGKINENIVCPICNKLFRSENVVFKHVKHCTGPSPNRSNSERRHYRDSQDFETKSNESQSDEIDTEEQEHKISKKRRSKDTSKHTDDIEIIERNNSVAKHHESRKTTSKTLPRSSIQTNNLVCEICGKAFRQSSYLAHHKLQHKNDTRKSESKSVFCCEVCNKEFRKLHHLVQHRIIHNPTTSSTRVLRKSSFEKSDNKIERKQISAKQAEDQSAGFRCEPCDKSFRKLHHLVEHRETHDGINRQKGTDIETIKPSTHNCDICNKTFKKLQQLVEHKEQHLDTGSEKSSLSTKDIIHECSLCYMVFPNEHSLNKHTIICQRKKKQSAAKTKQAAESQNLEDKEKTNCEISIIQDDVTDVSESEIITENNDNHISKDIEKADVEEDNVAMKILENDKMESSREKHPEEENMLKSTETKVSLLNEVEVIQNPSKVTIASEILTNLKKIEENENGKVREMPISKKKNCTKDKIAPSVTKRQKTASALPDSKQSAESSEDDEIRYMFNPDFKAGDTVETKFLLVKAKKRNSLQIEPPASRNLLKRRISLQHPHKTSHSKPKHIEFKTNQATTLKLPILRSVKKSNTPAISTKSPVLKTDKKSIIEMEKKNEEMSTDSDESDIKYSFPKNVKENTPNEVQRKTQNRQSLSQKRKSLSGIAKRKSLGKAIHTKHKTKSIQKNLIKKRTSIVEHRCDCGQLFSSAALLSRHTTLDHTPPRIRRRRSPPPEVETKIPKPSSRKSTTVNPQPYNEQKAGTSSYVKAGVATRKSSINYDPKRVSESRKSVNNALKVKTPCAAHKGVPVPSKAKKLMEKLKV